jgi:hypothetical protein
MMTSETREKLDSGKREDDDAAVVALTHSPCLMYQSTGQGQSLNP